MRIDPLGDNSTNGEYGIVRDNAFAQDLPSANSLGEIYAHGLRNPQRFSWDSATGDMSIADIGQSTFEEINGGENGANFGWKMREGSFQGPGIDMSGFVDPVAEYDRSTLVADLPPGTPGNRAITIAQVIRDNTIAERNGQLLLGATSTGLIFSLDIENDPLDGDGNSVSLLDLINIERSSRGLSNASRTDLRFSIGTNGGVFITNMQDGVIRRLTSLSAVPEPGTASFLLACVIGPSAHRKRS